MLEYWPASDQVMQRILSQAAYFVEEFFSLSTS